MLDRGVSHKSISTRTQQRRRNFAARQSHVREARLLGCGRHLCSVELDCHTSQWNYPLTPLSGSLTTWKVEALLVLRILPVLAPRPVAFTAYMRSRSILPFWKLSFDLLLQYALYGVVYEPIHCPPAQPVCQSCQPSCPVVLTARPYFGAQRRGTP